MKKFFKNHIFLMAFGIGLLFSVSLISYAAPTEDDLEEAQKERDEIAEQLDDKREEADGLKDKKKDLQKELKQLNEDLKTVSEHLEELEKEIKDTEEEIEKTEKELEEAKETEKWQYECMKKRIQFMYEKNDNIYIEMLFSAGSFSEFINFTEYLEGVAEYDQAMLKEYEATRKLIEEEEIRLNNEKIKLDALKVEAEAEKSRISGIVSKTSDHISQYSDQIAEAEKQALEFEEELRKKEEDIEKIKEEIALSQLAQNSEWRDISEIQFADGDRYLLANIIYCEAGGEPYEGQLAVGAVVINRVLSSRYPDTVIGVIYQPYQFSPVRSGRFELALTYNKATPSCYQAADEAMRGKTNVGSCLYFRTPIDGLTGIRIGGHIFY